MSSKDQNKQSRFADLHLRVPFFQPMWRRVALVAFLAIWLVFELLAGSTGWAFLVGGIGAYAAYIFFIDFRSPEETEDRAETSDDDATED